MKVLITFGDGEPALEQEWPAIPNKGDLVTIEDGLKLGEYLVDMVGWTLDKAGEIKEVRIHLVPQE